MSCLWCLNHCVRIPGDEQNADAKKEPMVDLVQILEELVWKEIKDDPPSSLSVGERICGLRKVLIVDVDTSFISVTHPDQLTLIPEDTRSGNPTGNDNTGHADPEDEDEEETEPILKTEDEGRIEATGLPTKAPKGTTFLFQSHYHNDTKHQQAYSFKTERQTKSTVEISMQRGFTMGQTLELDVKIPTGVKGCKVSGKLGGQMQWSFTKGKVSRQEEQVTWSVDSLVVVGAKKTGKAKLAVQEKRWEAPFSMTCHIRPRPIRSSTKSAPQKVVKFPVFCRRRTTKQLVKIYNIPCSRIIEAWPNHFTEVNDDPSVMVCKLEGQCSSVCSIKQEVWLEEAVLVPGARQSGIVHQDSVVNDVTN